MSSIEAVAIVDASPLYRQGLAAALERRGFLVHEPIDLVEWCRRPGSKAVVVGLVGESDLQLVAELRNGFPEIPIVGVLQNPDTDDFRVALKLGATSLVSRDVAAEDFVHVLDDAADHFTMLPTPVVHSLVRQIRDTGTPPDISEEESEWLKQMGNGVTVAQIADDLGFSRRDLHRRLRALYSRMGVASRSEALMRAGELGIHER